MKKKIEVTAIFDIGKTNKKIILFDNSLNVVFEKEVKFAEILDDDEFLGDDIDMIEKWIIDILNELLSNSNYNVKAVNFSTYGASLIYLDKKGKRLTPLYNYLKEMLQNIPESIYSENGGLLEFTRKTASPDLGFLNSGLQIKWLQIKKPEIYAKVKNVLHFPQYLSFLFTGRIISEYTSIGCHTALWDFDRHQYHNWVKSLDFELPKPISNSTVFENEFRGKNINFGVGIHDSSAALVPYLLSNKKEFILVSTGTWCVAMNPFNKEPLTQQEIKNNCLCYLSVNQEQVKSSRFYMGYMHEINAKRISDYFGVDDDIFKKMKLDSEEIDQLNHKYGSEMVFFKNGIPDNYLDEEVEMTKFSTYSEAYHLLMIDLTRLSMQSIDSIIPENDTTDKIFISGGFAKNEIYVKLLAVYFKDKEVYTSEADNASALGAAAVIWKEINTEIDPEFDLGLKLWKNN